MSDNRGRCPICECVMHGNRHYGSDRTHILVRELKAKLAEVEKERDAAIKEIKDRNEIIRWAKEDCEREMASARRKEQK